MKKWKAGQDYSTSSTCGMVRFIGGPMDGETGLYDTNMIDGISFCDSTEMVTHEYAPKRKGVSWDYIYKGSYYWTHGPKLIGDPVNGWRRNV